MLKLRSISAAVAAGFILAAKQTNASNLIGTPDRNLEEKTMEQWYSSAKMAPDSACYGATLRDLTRCINTDAEEEQKSCLTRFNEASERCEDDSYGKACTKATTRILNICLSNGSLCKGPIFPRKFLPKVSRICKSDQADGNSTIFPRKKAEIISTKVKVNDYFVSSDTTITSGTDLGSKMSWTDARDTCYSKEMSLISLSDMKQWGKIRRTLKQQDPQLTREFWIGANDLEDVGRWKWSDGAPLTLSIWAPGEPNNHDGGYCGMITKHPKRIWKDALCTEEKHFICEKTTDTRTKKQFVLKDLPPKKTVDPPATNLETEQTDGDKDEKETTETKKTPEQIKADKSAEDLRLAMEAHEAEKAKQKKQKEESKKKLTIIITVCVVVGVLLLVVPIILVFCLCKKVKDSPGKKQVIVLDRQGTNTVINPSKGTKTRE